MMKECVSQEKVVIKVKKRWRMRRTAFISFILWRFGYYNGKKWRLNRLTKLEKTIDFLTDVTVHGLLFWKHYIVISCSDSQIYCWAEVFSSSVWVLSALTLSTVWFGPDQDLVWPDQSEPCVGSPAVWKPFLDGSDFWTYSMRFSRFQCMSESSYTLEEKNGWTCSKAVIFHWSTSYVAFYWLGYFDRLISQKSKEQEQKSESIYSSSAQHSSLSVTRRSQTGAQDIGTASVYLRADKEVWTGVER